MPHTTPATRRNLPIYPYRRDGLGIGGYDLAEEHGMGLQTASSRAPRLDGFRFMSAAVCAAVGIACALICLGWLVAPVRAEQLSLPSPFPAALLATSSIAIWTLRYRTGYLRYTRAFVLGVFILLVACGKLLGHVDRLAASLPELWHRMSPVSALNLIMLGAGIALIAQRSFKLKAIGQICAGVVLLHTMMATEAYVCGNHLLFYAHHATPVTWPSLLTAGALAIALLSSRPNEALMGMTFSNSSAGVAMRHVLPMAAFAPVTLAWLDLSVHHRLGIDPGLGLIGLATVLQLLMGLLVWRSGHVLARIERQREDAQSQLVHAKETAEQASKAKSEFIANVSHEIRTPMTAILGYLELLKDSPNLSSANCRRWTNTMHESAEKLLAILNDLLDLSRIEASKLTLHVGPCDPQQVVDDVARLLEPQAQAKALAFDVEFAGQPDAMILTDSGRLRQILINMVGNAIKFTESGRISVRGRTLWIRPGAARLILQVTDTGIGMSGEALSRLFQPFGRVQGGARIPGSGAGLGLSISQRLARLLGGEIEVQSSPGRGSTFTLRLDVQCEPSRADGNRPEVTTRMTPELSHAGHRALRAA